MKLFPFSSKRSRPALSMETFKRSPGAVMMDESGRSALSTEALSQIDLLRASQGWGIQSAPRKRTPWWRSVWGRVKHRGSTSQPNGVGLPGGGMSTGILRPLVVRQHNAAREWRSFKGRWER